MFDGSFGVFFGKPNDLEEGIFSGFLRRIILLRCDCVCLPLGAARRIFVYGMRRFAATEQSYRTNMPHSCPVPVL